MKEAKLPNINALLVYESKRLFAAWG